MKQQLSAEKGNAMMYPTRHSRKDSERESSISRLALDPRLKPSGMTNKGFIANQYEKLEDMRH
jgi:hypothetical protein